MKKYTIITIQEVEAEHAADAWVQFIEQKPQLKRQFRVMETDSAVGRWQQEVQQIAYRPNVMVQQVLDTLG